MPCFLSKTTSTHLTGKWKFEKEIEYSIGDPGAQGMLQIHLIALDDIIWVLGPPPCHHPADRTYTSHNAHPVLLVMLHWSPFKPITLFIKLFPLNIWNVVYVTTLSVRWCSPYNMPWRDRGRAEAWLHNVLILALDVGGWSTQRPSCFTFWKSLDTYCSRLGGPQGQSGWVSVKRKSLAPSRDRTLDCPARRKSLYQLRYPGSFKAVSTSDYTAGVVSYTSSGSHTSEGNLDKSHELIKTQLNFSSSDGFLYLLNHDVNFSYESHFFRKSFKAPFTVSLLHR